MELEKVQLRTARWVLNNYGRFNSVTSVLDHLSWPTLQTHRKLSRLHTFYKLFYHQLLLSIAPYYLSAIQSTRQYHALHYILPCSSMTAHQNSHFSKIISDWNKLPTHLIEVADTDTFKTEVQSLLYLYIYVIM